MRSKVVVPRALAVRDVEAAVEHYRDEASEVVALGFVEALQNGYTHISRHHPGSGSTRFSHELNLPGLRSRLLRDYPYIIFYVEREECIDVWRALHGQRDIPAWLRA
ncbi:MAG TPA: type II toxin-antitoxin system RelE/ParE family toxin [Woeseiaceae bacterium]|nr:type II toxin-antitoxin system RelE/ParE family toxin [Woeseiaceae bacterium]